VSIAKAYANCPGGGGCGAGIGEPLAVRKIEPVGGGGTGAGIGEPLALNLLKPGDAMGWVGCGLPFRNAGYFVLLLDNGLTELLTGSTIETTSRSSAKRTEKVFMMVEPSWSNHEEVQNHRGIVV
jgi:hypothetical protein